MRRWSEVFCPDGWKGVHPAVYAAQAHASLIAIRPFEDGNGRVARMVADKIMHDHGYPAIGLSAVHERYRAPINARLFDAIANDDVEGWIRAFIALAIEGTDTVNQQIPQLRQDLDQLAVNMGHVTGNAPKCQYDIAVSMLAYPVDRPVTFAGRYGLTREQTTELLRSLSRAGLVELGRINGKQIFITHPGLKSVQDLARPRPAHRQEIASMSLKAAPERRSLSRSVEHRTRPGPDAVS